jgi:hypothetical protein
MRDPKERLRDMLEATCLHWGISRQVAANLKGLGYG